MPVLTNAKLEILPLESWMLSEYIMGGLAHGFVVFEGSGEIRKSYLLSKFVFREAPGSCL